ncbi:TRL domain-containing protein [Leptospira idonii]|uniref:TRL-like family protein n=1 Tax=Leptospira idonii TaxID=1193500 RepID=A0A4R9LZ38_9LEPT|nr:TRL domain-containing protein [Leptospira idonii]TGN19002.1 TRL-like family protein [Leptospira idonii]
MKKMITILLILMTICLFQACNITQGPTHGALFSHTKFPGDFNPSNEVKSQRTAEGCTYTVLSLFSFGDSGAGKIAKENGIIRIASVDYKATIVYTTLFTKFCSVVTGESK